MNNRARRILSCLLVLVLCISLVPGAVIPADAATVNYVTGNVDNLTGVVYNWGRRGTTATFLSPMAEDFYDETGYEELIAFDGGTGTSNAPSSQLYKELAQLMKSNHDYITSYDATRNLYAFTDCQNSDGSSISSFYSGAAIGPAWDGGKTWNREHTWPNSKGLNGNDENDIMMLRPTASSENSSRGNTAYGKSSSYYDPNEVSNGRYNLHGDVARIMLYVYVRWGNTSHMWGTGGVMESLDVLLEWMEEDPVDTWEMGRNDSVQSITGTRNVFVDFPELAFLLFGEAVPEMTTPSGNAAGSQYTITATVNDAAMGRAVVNGRTITAYPAEGHYLVDYALASGEAVITRSGNILTVSASSDCTVQLNFAARQELDVTYYENNAQAAKASVYAGDTVTLPGHAGSVPEGYNFIGWVTAPLAQTEDKPAEIYGAGSRYTVDAATAFYSLYSKVDTQAGGAGNIFTRYTGAVTEGDYIIYYADTNAGAMAASQSASPKRLDYRPVTIVSDMIELPDAAIVWHIAPTSDGYVSIYNSAAGKYAAGNGAKNTLVLSGSLDSYSKWTPSGTKTYEFVNLGNKNAGVNSNLRKNENYGFSCYATQTGGALTLFKAAAGTVYYSTGVCNHENARDVAAVPATCTATGFTAGIFCDDCGLYISGHAVVDMLPHAWDEGTVTVEATFENVGQIEYTCGTCGTTETEEFTKPLIDLEGTSMTLGDSLEVAFIFDITQLEEDGAMAYITKSYADGREAVTVEIPQENWKVFSGNLYYFSFAGVAAKEMCDSLSVEVCNTFGTRITNPYTDSIQEYAMRMLEKDETIADEKLRTLYVDMLLYGAAAQAQFDYDAGNPADALLTEEQRTYATGTCTTEDNLVEGPGRAGTALTLKSRMTLDFIFSNAVLGEDPTGIYAVATFTDHAGRAVETRIETFRAYDSQNSYVSVPGLAVADFATVVSCTVYDAQGNALASAADSIEGYAHRMADRIPAMVEAIVKFGTSAYQYFHG